MAEQPEQFSRGRIRGEREATKGRELVGTSTRFQLPDDVCCASVRPHNGVVERVARFGVPDARCLALVGDADGFDGGKRVTSSFKLFAGFGYAGFYRRDEFEGVMLVPSREKTALAVDRGCLKARGCPHPGCGYICLNST